jgi:tRNA threonylcarbamoyladenosine biosynthesis protein TsaB
MILALDTATRQAGLAIYDGESVRAETIWRTTDRHHTEWLVPAIEIAFKQAGITVKELTAVAVTKGPGSYTGLRVALSVAKGLVAALGIPLIGVNTLDVLAQPFMHNEGQRICAAVPLGRGRFAYHFYWALPEFTEEHFFAPPTPKIGTLQAIAAEIQDHYSESHIKMVGEFTREEQFNFDGDQTYHIEFVPSVLAMRRPSVVALLAAHRLQNGERDDPHTLEPIYLQPHA